MYRPSQPGRRTIKRVTDAPFSHSPFVMEGCPDIPTASGCGESLALGGTDTAWERTSSVVAPPCPGPRRRRVFATGAYRGRCCAHRSLNRQVVPVVKANRRGRGSGRETRGRDLERSWL